MKVPRYSEQELWEKLRALEGRTIESLARRYSHTIVACEDPRKRYTIRHNRTGKEVMVRLVDVYALYLELYRFGSLTNRYMNEHCQRILGRSEWRAPGSAMFAVLPHLDGNIQSRRGKLYIPGHQIRTH